MNQVTSIDIINYLNSLKNGIDCTPNTLNTLGTKKNVLSAFWSYLVEQKIVDENIIKQIPGHLYKSEITNHVVKIPTEDQLENFINSVEQGNNNDFDCTRNIAIVQLFLGSGIRSEELIGLDVSDLHFEEEAPYITVMGKGKREIKDEVFISAKAKYYLEDYLIKRDEFVTDRGIKDENALFLSNRCNRISKTPIASFFSAYSDGQINPHMLRHWVGTVLYEKTKDIVFVQRQLRHRSLETAAKFYVHMDKSKMASLMMSL
jgi:site-specific recombinase XerD